MNYPALLLFPALPLPSSFFIVINPIITHLAHIFQQQIPMEMKINFDQLFSTSLQPDLNTTIQSPSLEMSHQITSSLNNSLEYKYSFNNKFFDSEELQEPQDADLEEDYPELVQQNKSVKSVKKVTTNASNKFQAPGERLFYESQQLEQRKIKQREKIQHEKQVELSKIVTFVPTINQKSRKMAEKLKQEAKAPPTKPKNQLKSTVQLREEQSKKECTFHPKLIAKNKNQVKSKEQLFYYLHNTSKIKDIKLSKLAQQYGPQGGSKKGNQEDITNFLKRNEEYTSLVKKKQQILKINSEKYDLKTGEKLFSPKISDGKSFNFHSTCSFKQNTQKHPIKYKQSQPVAEQDVGHRPKSSIFNKKYHEEEGKQYKYGPEKSNEAHDDLQQRYRQYSREYDKLNSQRSKGSRQVIPEQDQHPAPQKVGTFSPSNGQIQIEDPNIWGSNQIKPFQLSNVNQYLNASQEQDQQPKNNYVMEILSNLMVKHEEE